eukprot:jgi/Botrbrau1/772/Bobra.0181s0026.1
MSGRSIANRALCIVFPLFVMGHRHLGGYRALFQYNMAGITPPTATINYTEIAEHWKQAIERARSQSTSSNDSFYIDRSFCGGAPYSTFNEYFLAVYPLAKGSCISETDPENDIQFFYAKAPPLSLPPLDGLPNGPAAFNYLPFPYGSPYLPSFVDPCTFYINQYPPTRVVEVPLHLWSS